MERVSPALAGGFLTTGPSREVLRYNLLLKYTEGLPWWPSDPDSALTTQASQVQSLVRELDPRAAVKDPACHMKAEGLACHHGGPAHQINQYFLKGIKNERANDNIKKKLK